MPVPARLTSGTGSLAIDSSFSVALTGYRSPRLHRAADRLLGQLSRQTGIPLIVGLVTDPDAATLVIHTRQGVADPQSAVEDESYTLTVTPQGARLEAATPYGTLRGMETFLQAVAFGADGFAVPGLSVEDAPRFPWRGLLMDVSRHWMPMEVLKRNLDAMAAVKLNVLHVHLTEDQGFRVESKLFPRLHQMGSDGLYFTQEEIKEIIDYARDRGIRVVPEFDMPGHTTSWFVGHPELASAPGPYEIERRWGIFDPALDPTREETYDFLDRFIGEMAALFPDPYFHIGGDEVTGRPWDENPRIQAFMQEHGLQDNHDLQAYFNQRVNTILEKYGKKMVGWDEILHPDLPKDIVIQSWRGQASLAEAARMGYRGILSFGYYLDHILPASVHYYVDPLAPPSPEARDVMLAGGFPANAITDEILALTPEQQALILGGEAAMWAEFVTPETVDSRIWPRAAAIAERLWSPAEQTQDTEDMYRRLEATSRWLEWVGVQHRSNYRLMLQRLAAGHDVAPLQTLVELVEPVKFYQRGQTRTYTQHTPLHRVVDAARPESQQARVFSNMVDAFLSDPAHQAHHGTITSWLRQWRDNHEALQPVLQASPLLDEIEPLSRLLSQVATLGLQAVEALQTGAGLPAAEQQEHTALLDRAGEQQGAVLLQVVPPIRRLVEAAH